MSDPTRLRAGRTISPVPSRGPRWVIVVAGTLSLLVTGCGATNYVKPPAASGSTTTLPAGVMSASDACQAVVGRHSSRFFTDVEGVHLVFTTYSKGIDL